MQQKQSKVSKRALWSVYVFVERDIQVGRSRTRRRRLTIPRIERHIPGVLTTVLYKFLYINVTKLYKKKGMLYVQIGIGKKKEIHSHELKSVVSIQTREYKRSGVQ